MVSDVQGIDVDAAQPAPPEHGHSSLGALTLGALGVVFGDIGTSPLYSVQAVFADTSHRVAVTGVNVYGVISLMFWAVTILISVKYVTFVMRADDRGEGGIMALTSLVQGARAKRAGTTALLVTFGILGACLFFGDGAITPAISVLSAVEGLKVALPGVASLVVPVTVVVLVLLFAIQRFGTGVVGRLFGPVMLVWFAVLAIAGTREILLHPGVLQALLPSWGVRFIAQDPVLAFFALGAIVLAVTGAEALYADMGHFGRRPIRVAWFFLVFPALTLEYLGQGALVLSQPSAKAFPFYLLLPHWARLPMVFLATAATVIASQAVISGAFSVSQQAVQLGFLPRLTLRHTSRQEVGQIYIPAVTGILFVAVVAIVVGFGSSEKLSNAYGVAVTATFMLDSILFLSIARLRWHTRRRWIALGALSFLTVEFAFFASNVTKVVKGGWLPLLIASILFTILMTWRVGRAIVTRNRNLTEGLLADFIERLSSERYEIQIVPGTAVFLTPNLRTTPLALRANVRYNHVLHDHNVVVQVLTERVPHVPEDQRIVPAPRVLFSGATGEPVGDVAERITLLTLRFGYLDEPDVPQAVRLAVEQHVLSGAPDLDSATYFLSQITIGPTGAPGLARWRKKLFVTIARNAASPTEYFRLPDSRTVITSGRIPL